MSNTIRAIAVIGHRADGQNIHISLCFNPSHLEYVNPVAMGRTRARQDRHGDYVRRQVFCLLIHGDAAFAGEGIVQEALNLSELAGYTVGGTLHVVLNNQIGFTTTPEEYRSTAYATGIARMLQSPVFPRERRRPGSRRASRAPCPGFPPGISEGRLY